MYYKNLDLEDIVYVNDKGIECVEKWKDVPGYEGIYQVSDLGRVKSLERFIFEKSGKKRIKYQKIKKQKIDDKGYLRNEIDINGKRTYFKIHQIVAVLFLNHNPNGYKIVVDHINNIKTDNRVENLQLISPRENSSKDQKNKTSKYTGVSWCKRSKKWTAYIKIGKIINLGSSLSEKKMSDLYNKAIQLKEFYNGNNNDFRTLIKKALNRVP